MAALRPMLSLAREETTLITSELASVASASRVAIGDSAVGAGRVAAEMNPLAVKQAIRAGAEEGSGFGGMGLRQTLEVSVKDLSSVTPLSRQAVEAGMKDGDSILSHHLTLSPHPPSLNTTSLLHSHPNLAASGSSTQSVITSAIEQDMGQTLKEVLSNAGQTGVEEQMDQVLEVAKVLAKGAVESG